MADTHDLDWYETQRRALDMAAGRAMARWEDEKHGKRSLTRRRGAEDSLVGSSAAVLAGLAATATPLSPFFLAAGVSLPLIVSAWKQGTDAGVRATYYAATAISKQIDDDLAQFAPTRSQPYTRTLTAAATERLNGLLKAFQTCVDAIHKAAS